MNVPFAAVKRLVIALLLWDKLPDIGIFEEENPWVIILTTTPVILVAISAAIISKLIHLFKKSKLGVRWRRSTVPVERSL